MGPAQQMYGVKDAIVQHTPDGDDDDDHEDDILHCPWMAHRPSIPYNPMATSLGHCWGTSLACVPYCVHAQAPRRVAGADVMRPRQLTLGFETALQHQMASPAGLGPSAPVVR